MNRTTVGTGRVVLFWAIALGGAAFDLTTKTLVFSWLGEPQTSAPQEIVPGVVDFRTNYNTGALYGFLGTWQYASLAFAALSIVAAGVILWWLFGKGAASDNRLNVALALVMAGATGNCVDRLWFGKVRDFVYVHVDPIGFQCAIFNFADNMLVAGAILIMLLALRPDRSPKPDDAKGGEIPAPAPEALA